jgi:S-layer homology domain
LDGDDFKYIQKMKEQGITLGCGTNSYCPDVPVTRGQMAAFLIRAKLGDAFTYSITPVFNDVLASNTFFRFVQKMAELGITSGCGPSQYCPDSAVTRGQMAVFIGRIFFSYGLANANPPQPPATGPTLAGCPVFPADNVWNTPVDTLPVDPNSAAWIQTIGSSRGLKADFGSGLYDGGPIGIPYAVVSGSQARTPVVFDYADESDAGPYPIPPDPPIEGGPQSSGDRHILLVDKDNCILYELYNARLENGAWAAGSGAIFALKVNGPLRPSTWTSADAAGLPIVPGLVRYDEFAAGEIKHAIRFTVPQTRRAFIWPARHYASSLTGSQYPPMGARFRLKASFDVSPFSPEVQAILRALKKYGMILADNGSAWFMSGVPDDRWNNDHLRELAQVLGSNLEAVDTSSMVVDVNSGQARQP